MLELPAHRSISGWAEGPDLVLMGAVEPVCWSWKRSAGSIVYLSWVGQQLQALPLGG